MKTVLIVGGAGYIGSRLRQVLIPTQEFNVQSVDAGWVVADSFSTRLDCADITKDMLSAVDAVILLAGHSSVKSCDGDIRDPWRNNVTNFVSLLDKLGKDKPLIYASSASIYGNSKPGEYHTESNSTRFSPINNYDLTKYVLDLQAEIALRDGYKVMGLRFGTVNGWSPNLRTDVMINAMYHTAQTEGKITVVNPHIGRAILGIEDLCRGVIKCLDNPTPGIYNMASFNSTVGEIASTVANRLGVPVVDKGPAANAYDFGLDCSLFSRTFSYEFIENAATIVDSLVGRYNESFVAPRDKFIQY
jgi:UDP-glucose 4-epimerase